HTGSPRRPYRVEQVVARRGRCGEVVDDVDGAGDLDAVEHVLPQQPEARSFHQGTQVGQTPGLEVVDAGDAGAGLGQCFTEVRADETGSPDDDGPNVPVRLLAHGPHNPFGDRYRGTFA